MVTNSFGNRNFIKPIRRFRGAQFFFLLGSKGGKRGDFFSSFFRFSMCSQQVLKTVPNNPNVFPKTFPIVLHFLSHIDRLPQLLTHCQVFRCTLPNFATLQVHIVQLSKLLIGTCTLPSFHVHIVKLLGTYCQVFQVCEYTL